MEEGDSCVKLVVRIYQTTQDQISEEGGPHSHSHENLKPNSSFEGLWGDYCRNPNDNNPRLHSNFVVIYLYGLYTIIKGGTR
jgi:hypothetical protein